MVEKFQNILPVKITVLGMGEGIIGGVITATTTAAKIPATPLADRKSIIVRNASGQDAYLGGSTVTSAGLNGFPFKTGEIFAVDLGPAVNLYVVLAAGSGSIHYLESA